MTTPPTQYYEFGPFRLDPVERQLLRDGQSVQLTPKAFDALLIFVENNNRLLGKDELISKLWPDSFVEESNLAQNVSTLRRALGEQPDGRQYIETVPQRVANELQVDKLLTGAYVKEGDDLRINLQFIDVTANRVLWSESLNLKYEKLLTIQDRVTQEVIGRLSLTLTPTESQQVRSRTPQNSLAYEYHLRGVDLYHKDELRTAADMLERAAELDPDYALTWSYLGTIYETLGSLYFGGREDYDKARKAYDQALALDPTQIEARIFMGAFLTNTGCVEQAVPLLRSVIQTNQNLAQAHWELAYAYRFGGLLKDSIAEGERARQIDNVIRANNSVFNSYLYDGQYDKFLQNLPPGESSAFITFYRGLGTYY